MNPWPDVSQWTNPGAEFLLAEYVECREAMERLQSAAVSPHTSGVPGELTRQLEAVEAALFPVSGPRKITVAWQLVHRIREGMLLLMGREELLAEGVRLAQTVQMSTLPPETRAAYVLEIRRRTDRLGDSGAVQDLAGDAHYFRSVLHIVNSHVDNLFWQIWCRKFLGLLYLAGLVLTLGILLFTGLASGSGELAVAGGLLLGATGGLAGGFLTGESPYITRGRFWLPVSYYFLSRPVLGALAGLVTLWILGGQEWIRFVEPVQAPQVQTAGRETGKEKAENVGRSQPGSPSPASGKAAAVSVARKESPSVARSGGAGTSAVREETSLQRASLPGGKSVGARKAAGPVPISHGGGEAESVQDRIAVAPSGAEAPLPVREAKEKPVGKGAVSGEGEESWVIRVPHSARPFWVLLLVFVAGFSGEKLLRRVCDRVTARLFVNAEKTENPGQAS